MASPDGKWVASADEDSVILWRTEDGSIVKDWNVPLLLGLVFTSESRVAIWYSDRLVVQDMEDPSDSESVAGVPLAMVQDSTRTTCVWSPDGTLCALSRWDSDPQTNTFLFHIRIYRTEPAEAMSYHQLRASGGHREITYPIFSHDSRRLLFTYNSWMPDDLADGEFESASWIWDILSTTPPRKLMSFGTLVHCSTFNPVNSAQVFITLSDHTIQVRDVASGIVLARLNTAAEFPWPVERIPERNFWQPLYSPDGKHVVISCPDGNSLLCNLESGATTSTLIGVSDTSWVMFSPDATRILSTTPDAPPQLWDTHTGLPLLSLHAHIHRVFEAAASFSPDGRYIAAGYKDGTVRLWDSQDGTCLAVFTEHLAPVTCLTFTPDVEILCSAAEDGTVYMRRLRDTLGQ